MKTKKTSASITIASIILVLVIAVVFATSAKSGTESPVLADAAAQTDTLPDDLGGKGNPADSTENPEAPVSGLENEDYYSLTTSFSKTEVETFAAKVREELLNHDWEALGKDMVFPFSMNGTVFQSYEDFIAADFETHLNPAFFEAVEKATAKDMFFNWQGVMLDELGYVWIQESFNADLSSKGLKVGAINDMLTDGSSELPEGSKVAKDSDFTALKMVYGFSALCYNSHRINLKTIL